MTSICFVAPAHYLSTVGGAEVQLHMMAAGLAASGTYDVFYATPDIEASTDCEGVRVVKIPERGGARQCLFEDFAQALDSVSADLVIQLGRKQFTWYAARYCSSRGLPFVFSAASDIDCRPFRELPRYFGEFPVRRLSNPGRLLKAFQTDRRTLAAMKSADLLVAQTGTQKRRLERMCGKQVEIFQNLHAVPPEETIVKAEPPVVLWLASIKPVKRPRLFLELSRRLRGCGARVVMAGRMNAEGYRADVEELVQSGDLEYVERVSFEESNELIARASVFVLTSRHEGLPNTLIQSWLRRTPTVSLGVDPDGMIASEGIGVHATGVNQAAEAIRDLVQDPERRARMADAARRFAVERFGMDAQVQRLDAYIRKALHAG